LIDSRFFFAARRYAQAWRLQNDTVWYRAYLRRRHQDHALPLADRAAAGRLLRALPDAGTVPVFSWLERARATYYVTPGAYPSRPQRRRTLISYPLLLAGLAAAGHFARAQRHAA